MNHEKPHIEPATDNSLIEKNLADAADARRAFDENREAFGAAGAQAAQAERLRMMGGLVEIQPDIKPDEPATGEGAN